MLITDYTTGPQGRDQAVVEAMSSVSDDEGHGGDGEEEQPTMLSREEMCTGHVDQVMQHTSNFPPRTFSEWTEGQIESGAGSHGVSGGGLPGGGSPRMALGLLCKQFLQRRLQCEGAHCASDVRKATVVIGTTLASLLRRNSTEGSRAARRATCD